MFGNVLCSSYCLKLNCRFNFLFHTICNSNSVGMVKSYKNNKKKKLAWAFHTKEQKKRCSHSKSVNCKLKANTKCNEKKENRKVYYP